MKEKKAKKMALGIVIAAITAMMVIPMGIIASEGSKDTASVSPFQFDNAQRAPFELKELGTGTATTGNTGNVLVTPDSPEDDCLPAITIDGDGNIVATWTHTVGLLESNIGLGYSQDGGNSWISRLVILEGVLMFSDIAYVHGADFEGGGDFNGLWGVYGDILNNNPSFYRMSDITNTETYEFYSWTTEYEDITYACISDNTWYKEFNYDVTGPTNMYIYHVVYSAYDIPDCPAHWYVDGALEAGGVGYFDAQSELVTAPAKDPDMACLHDSNPAQTLDDYVLLTWQHDNQTTGKSEIVLKKIVPEEEPDIEYTSYQWYIAKGDTFDAAHPNIGASGSNAAVVYQTTDNIYGDWDIKCAYSSDNGETWETSMVAESHPTNEVYPAAYMSGNTVFCTYIREGNLYLVKSEDGGATWEEPEQINEEDGTVVAEENSVDVHAGGIVWVDTRNGNKDIYYAPLPCAIINVKDISGGMGISATITNTGTEDASNVDWSIELTGLIFIGKE
ncbi:MAG: sialidase family protein, partial [Candidatus Thermoplasmatota archaeon]|nr:sialidase family protein [Candidatus Thermoplasmatota archaeon]